MVEPDADIAVARFDRVARIGIVDRRGQRVGRAELQYRLPVDPLAVDVVEVIGCVLRHLIDVVGTGAVGDVVGARSEEHTSELQSLMRISYAVFCLKTKQKR